MATWWIGITHEGHAVADLTQKLQRASNLVVQRRRSHRTVNDRCTLSNWLNKPLDQRGQRSVAAGPFSLTSCARWGFETTGVFDAEAR